ncbi:hypothetical protein ACFQ4N_14890 [Oceanobacillus iheyensis]|uniref:Uncharacterized protein n=1 Tax=Oceanobacillus iheyensis (strain DSM 14371 / CIP 107618 / JCM 11309 / KCTC 3954 / HTE831) TaxID=221109 RepID=Q8ESZ8_OCEIH|nr:hypothetical protein [Oceanobacillus iheyensis]BAC12423.1 hypothetical protein [Oceanobacillus iheyensis HTE831]
MREAVIGAIFLVCLTIGCIVGYLFGSTETGGTIGLAFGLVSILLFRKRRGKDGI